MHRSLKAPITSLFTGLLMLFIGGQQPLQAYGAPTRSKQRATVGRPEKWKITSNAVGPIRLGMGEAAVR